MRNKKYLKKVVVWMLTGTMMLTLLPSNVNAQELNAIIVENEATTVESVDAATETMTEEITEVTTEITTEAITETTEAVTTETISTDTVNLNAAPQDAFFVSSIQERINALPTVAEFQAMSDGSDWNERQDAVYQEAQSICDALDELASEELALLNLQKLEDLMNYWNGAVKPMLSESDLDTSVSGITLYASGCLKSMKVEIRDKGGHDTAYGKIAIYNKTSGYDWDNRWTKNGDTWLTSEEIKAMDSGFMAFGDGAEFEWTDKKLHNTTVVFRDGQVDLKQSGYYYVYLCTRSTTYGVYPDACIKTLESKGDGKLYVSGSGTPVEQEHVHSWSYQANGSSIMAYCDDTSCNYHSQPVTVTLNASDSTYSGQAYSNAALVYGNSKITDGKFPVTSAGIEAITYSGVLKDGTTYVESPVAPTQAGNYVAKVRIANGSSHVSATNSFTIQPKSVDLVWNDLVFDYDGQPHIPTAVVKSSDLMGDDTCRITEVTGEQTQAGHDYVATATGLDDLNYVISDKSKTCNFRIKAGSLTLTVNNKTKHMGEEDPEYSYKISGNLVAGDKIKGITFERQSGEEAGQYTINAVETVGSNPNYNIIMQSGILTIEPHTIVMDKRIDATCTTDGWTERQYCSVCDKIISSGRKIPALGHDWTDDWKIVTLATEDKAGKKEKTCRREHCGQKKYEMIPALGAEKEPESPGQGNLEKDAEIFIDSPIREATMNNSKSDFLDKDNKIFSEDEKEAIRNGANAKVWLEISDAKIDDISEQDRKKITDKAQEIMGKDAQLTYFNADLFKMFANNDKVQIAEPGVFVAITIKIPDNLINKDSSICRDYKIIRLHNGQAEVIIGTFDESTNEYTFSTDKFSTYAIAYTDTKIENPSDNEDDKNTDNKSNKDKKNNITSSDSGKQKNQNAKKNHKNKGNKNEKSTKTVATGDNMHTGWYGTILLLSVVGIVIICRKRKKYRL